MHMYKSDALYQALLKYSFDLFRGNDGITKYISDHLKKYHEDIMSAINDSNPFLENECVTYLKSKLIILSEICGDISAILTSFDDGLIKDAYNQSDVLFEKIKPHLNYCFATQGRFGNYYRIRSGDFRISDPATSKLKKAELFHIKREKRNCIGAYRYSVAGYPCLYLASDVELAWFESGMPRQFSYCNMLMNEVSDDPLKLVNFSIRPVMLLSYINTELLNKRNKHEPETPIYNLLLNYILTYPIVATCSVKVKDRNSKFVEEYIFPQLFMQWIRESNDFDGILYKSSLNTNLVSGMGAVNVAFPVKQFRGDGLDKRLCQKISISDIGYFDVGTYFEKYQNILQEIIAYKNELQQFLIDATFFDPSLVELIELCDCIVKTYTTLIEGEYKNSDLLFTHINSLCDHAESLYQNRSAVIQRCIVQSEHGQTLPINQDIIEKQFERFHELCGQVLHKHTVFHFNFEPVQNWEKI